MCVALPRDHSRCSVNSITADEPEWSSFVEMPKKEQRTHYLQHTLGNFNKLMNVIAVASRIPWILKLYNWPPCNYVTVISLNENYLFGYS